MGALGGALIGGVVIAMITAQTLSYIPGAHGGWTTMAGAELADMAGLLLGATAGIWPVFRDGGRWAGSALTWLWVYGLLLIGCLGFVALS